MLCVISMLVCMCTCYCVFVCVRVWVGRAVYGKLFVTALCRTANT
jgi:hypothetical protein